MRGKGEPVGRNDDASRPTIRLGLDGVGDDLELPREAGPYRVLEEIATGGMSVVHRGRGPARGGQDVALKLAVRPSDRTRLVAEAAVLSAVQGPGVVPCLGLERAPDGSPALVMELLDGWTLRDVLGVGRPSPTIAMRLAARLAAALQRVHAAGFVHADVKPGNVHVTAEHVVTLLDFGLSRVHGSGGGVLPSDRDQVSGTPGYMAPEQLRGEAPEPATDVWALGCVLFECLAGQPAFQGTAAERASSVLTGEPEWSALPEGTPGIVRRRELLRDELDRDLAPERRVARAVHRAHAAAADLLDELEAVGQLDRRELGGEQAHRAGGEARRVEGGSAARAGVAAHDDSARISSASSGSTSSSFSTVAATSARTSSR